MEEKMSLFDTGVRPTIDKWLLDKSKELRDYGEYWSASSAGYCMRKNIFERLGVPHVEKEDDARKQRVFTSGHIFHQWIQDITKEAGISIAQELELQDEELMIRGHIDDLVLIKKPLDDIADSPMKGAVPRFVSDDNLVLYDYKTAHSRSFTYAKDRPMSHYHKMQLGTYMYMLRDSKYSFGGDNTPAKDLTEARILSISKDDLRMSEKQLLWTPDLEKEVVGYWTTLNGYWKNKKIPKCTCADYENGFLAQEKYNPYFRDGEPCNIKIYQEWKAKQDAV